MSDAPAEPESESRAPTEAESAPPPPPGGLVKESIWEVYYPGNVDADKRAIPVASFPMIIYFWPSMIVFLICGILQSANVSPDLLGPWATGALAFNLLIIVTDLSQKKFIIAVLAVVVVVLLSYISQLEDLGFVTRVGSWLGGLQLFYSTHVYFLVSGFLWLFFVFGLIQPRFNYWLIEPNEFTHYVQPFGRDQSIPRQGSTVTREVPDVLELMLTFGGGTLVIRRDNQVIARIEHVPFLGKRMKAIERMLGVTRVRSMS